MSTIRILFLGDIVGRPGREVIIRNIAEWRKSLNVLAVIANGENASGGNGLTTKNAGELIDAGVDVITGGNHIWRQKDYAQMFSTYPSVIRPANYPDETPGEGYTKFSLSGGKVAGVINLQGRVFMDPTDCPFKKADTILDRLSEETNMILVDMHAEATSEKVAMGWYLDGRVSAVVGTHTHVPSADYRILPGGTGYLTDLGMVGPMDGVLGVDREPILKRFTTGLPARFSIAEGPVQVNGAVIEIDPDTGKALDISPFRERHESVEAD